MTPLPRSLGPTTPCPTPSVDSEHCVSPFAHHVFSVAQTDSQASQRSGLEGQAGVSAASVASDEETLTPALLAGQPLVYVPSTSLFMLCRSLQERPAPGSERDSGSLEVTAAQPSSPPSVQKRLGEERKPHEEEPVTKRQSRDRESPLSLVIPKVREFRWTGSGVPTAQSCFLTKVHR